MDATGKGSREESPIKRPSVSENTPWRGNNYCFPAEGWSCCVQPPSEPFLRLCRDVSRVVSVDLRCRSFTALVTHQDQGFRPVRGLAPSAPSGPENLRFHAVSKCFLDRSRGSRTNPMMVHDMGGKESGIPDLSGVSGLLIRSGGSSNPFPGSPLTPTH